VDLDNDGRQDLIVNGDTYQTQIFWNEGVDSGAADDVGDDVGDDVADDDQGHISNATIRSVRLLGCTTAGGDAALGECGYANAGSPMGLSVADVDGDGLLDFFITTAGPRAPLSTTRETAPNSNYGNDADDVGNRLYLNLGGRRFGCKGRTCGNYGNGRSRRDSDGEMDGVRGGDGKGNANGGSDVGERGNQARRKLHWLNSLEDDDVSSRVDDGSLAAAAFWGIDKGGWGWGTALFDFDNDRDIDVIMTNGFSTCVPVVGCVSHARACRILSKPLAPLSHARLSLAWVIPIEPQ
jgi:hypothetical protein